MSDDGNITYEISLCKAVLANGHSAQNCHGDTSVCMHYKNGTVLSGGNFSTESKTSQGNEKGELWLVMTGDKCLESQSEKMTTLIGLKCGPTLVMYKYMALPQKFAIKISAESALGVNQIIRIEKPIQKLGPHNVCLGLFVGTF